MSDEQATPPADAAREAKLAKRAAMTDEQRAKRQKKKAKTPKQRAAKREKKAVTKASAPSEI